MFGIHVACLDLNAWTESADLQTCERSVDRSAPKRAHEQARTWRQPKMEDMLTKKPASGFRYPLSATHRNVYALDTVGNFKHLRLIK